jgi:hypothetical protein
MATIIAFRPDDGRGVEILDELEQRSEIRPTQVLADGTRRYYLDAANSDVHSFEPMFAALDATWRRHITNLSD